MLEPNENPSLSTLRRILTLPPILVTSLLPSAESPVTRHATSIRQLHPVLP